MIDLSLLRQKTAGRKVAIVGLGKSGMPVFHACRAAGVDTVLWDDNPEQRSLAQKEGGDVQEMTESVLSSCAFVCLSPGIPLTHPVPHPIVTLATKLNIPVMGDIEMFHMAKPDARVIGITGTNGKSTTTALIGHILSVAGKTHAVGGNIGEAVLSLPDLPVDGIYVIELSSYQIDLLHDFRPHIAAHINFSADHLDRHGDMAGYVAVKEKMFDGQGVAVIGIDDPDSYGMFERIRAKGTRKTIPVSCKRPLMTGVYASMEGMMFDGAKKIFNLETCPALKGEHNWQNTAIAYAVCEAAGVSAVDIIKGLQTFGGLEHRQNLVATIHSVAYVNDSKATNDEAAAVALKTYPAIYWIAGGKSKGSGYPACEQHLQHVRHAFLIGAAQDEMAAWLDKKHVPYTRCETLEQAVPAAQILAEKEHLAKAVVLLSPACASFDQFKSFEHRGDVFTALVNGLAEKGNAA